MEKKLFLLDAYALIYRAYYALIRAPRVTSTGMNTSAIFGFVNTLNEVLRKEEPTHIAVCFDPPGPTFRHEMYDDYKAGRDKQPEDITAAIPYIKRILAAMRIPVIEIEGYEADDVIGTLSRRAEAAGFTTYMMTPDKDYGQLITDHVLMYRPSIRGEGFEIRGPQEIEAKYGIQHPKQVIDLLALEGDVSDNIPGCPGIGEKGAVKLINEWGSVENLIAHIADLKGAMQRKVSENREQILFSKELATIRTDVPIPKEITLESFAVEEPDVEALRKVYTELEFRSFLAKLSAQPAPLNSPPRGGAYQASQEGMMGSLFDTVPVPPASPLKGGDKNSEMMAVRGCDVLPSPIPKTVGISLVTAGTTPMDMELRGVAVAWEQEGEVLVTYLAADDVRFGEVKALIDSHKHEIVCHDVKTAMIVLRERADVRLRAPYYDTSVAHYLLEPERKHDLSQIASTLLEGYSPTPALEAAEAKKPVITPESAREAAALSLQLKKPLDDLLAREQLTHLLTDIELPMIRVLAAMERTGVRIDAMELHRLSKEYTARMNELKLRAFEIAGCEFNVSSPSQVGEVLFERLKIDPKAKKTKTGAYSTTEDILEKYRGEHPIAGLILDIRALRKLLATYLDTLPTLVNPRTGKIHTTYNQTVTATGRISSANPNLQNIPVRTADGREIRRAFIPDNNCLMLSADYSQIELRLIADISGDEAMIEAFREGHDIHRATAAKIYHKTLEETSDELRRNAKTANFGIIYGISAFGLSERLGIPRTEAKELIDGYFRTYPQIREYIDTSVARAREKGYVTTVMGRRRMLPDINSRSAVVRGYAERNAINAPIQGSAADIIKRAMIDVFGEMEGRGMRSRMIMQVHDELIFNVVPDELPTLQEIVTRCMENAYHGRVALEVSSGVGANWLEAH